MCFLLFLFHFDFVSLLRFAFENCQIMERAESSVCCQEIERVKNKLIQAVSVGNVKNNPHT